MAPNNTTQRSGIYRWCIPILSLLMIAMITMSAINWYHTFRTNNWPTTTATLITLQVTNSLNPLPDQIENTNNLITEYTYNVNDTTHTNNTIAIHTFHSSNAYHHYYRDLKQQYTSDQSISVHYNPQDPAESTIYRDANIDMYWYTAIPLFWFLALTTGWLFSKRTPTPSPHNPSPRATA